ncbi:MAG: NADH-quinone oxidoreductase subunit D [Pseudomonadota bacterium]
MKVERKLQDPEGHTLFLNMGPQHPSTHGVLRVVLKMDGEYIEDAEPVLGYIHRMHEKMGENRTYAQYLPNMGRVDYLSALIFNHGYAGAVERLTGIVPPPRAEYIRVITCELNRISSHLLWFGAYVMDLGGFTPFLYSFDDRENILDLLESVTGSRLTYCYFRFGGVNRDIADDFIAGTRAFIKRLRSRLPMYETLVTKNVIFINRVKGIGIITPELARRYGCTGPVMRGAGVKYDIRKNEPYSVYPEFDFDVPVQHGCDAQSRYIVRMLEMEQSMRIIEQALDKLPEGPVMAPKVPKKLKPPKGDCYFAVETARGEFGTYIVSDGSNNAYRIKLRVPGFSNLSCFQEISKDNLLADAVSALGSLDLVIPEIDR